MQRRFPTCFIAVWLLASCPLSAQTTTPTTLPTVDTLELERQAEKAGILKSLLGSPQLPPAKLDDVVILGIDHGHLTLTTRLPPTGTQSRIDIAGLDGICTLTSRQAAGDAVPNAPFPPDFFLLEWYRFDEPNLTDSATTVEGLPTSVHVSWTGENKDGVVQIQLLDQVSPMGPASPANIVLRATVPQKAGEPDSQIELRARDFLSLRREHPTEVEQYMGPIFRELHADGALLPSDTILAWQVFAAEAKPDPDLIEKIHKLVDRLDADDYKERDAAAKDLEKIGPTVGIELARTDRSKLSPEQASRVDGLLKEFHPVSEETASRLDRDKAFLLNCLQDTDNFVARTALTHLQKISPDISFDLSLKGQSRRDAIQQLRERLGRMTR